MNLARPFIASAAFLLIAGIAAAVDNLIAGLWLATGALGFALVGWMLVICRRILKSDPLVVREF
jgi:hypothetical protein